MVQEIIKRDGQIETFKPEKIVHAIFKAAKACGGSDYERAEEMGGQVVAVLENEFKDLRQLLLDGFGGVAGKVESAPAKHLRSFLGQIVNSTFTTQGETAGAQAWSSFDTYCALYPPGSTVLYSG